MARKFSPLVVSCLEQLRHNYEWWLKCRMASDAERELAAAKIDAITSLLDSQGSDPKDPAEVLAELAEFARLDNLFTEQCNREDSQGTGLHHIESRYRAAADALFAEIMGRKMTDLEFGKLCSL